MFLFLYVNFTIEYHLILKVNKLNFLKEMKARHSNLSKVKNLNSKNVVLLHTYTYKMQIFNLIKHIVSPTYNYKISKPLGF